jgi:hypothetical protein
LGRIVAITFDGHGGDATRSSGDAYYFSTTGEAPVGSAYRWIPGLTDLPSAITTTLDPFTGDMQASAFSFALAASDRIAQAFMAEQIAPPHELFTASLSDSATTLTLATASSYPSSGEVIWIGDESIFLVSGSGPGYATVQRGYYNSTATSHTSGAAVFTSLPYWRGRAVRLIEQDTDTGTITTRWRGLVTDIEQDGPRVIVQTVELLGALGGAEVNTESAQLRHTFRWRPGPGGYLLGEVVGLSPALWSISDGDTLTLQVDDALVSATLKGGGTVWRHARASYLLEGSPRTGADGEDGGDEIAAERAYEVLAWSRAASIAPTSSLSQPYHPVVVALALLTSTGTGDNGPYDVLGEAAGLGVPWSFFSGVEAFVADTTALAIDRLVLGWDGEPWTPWARAQTILRAFGLLFGRTGDGLITIQRLRTVTVGDLDGASSLTLYPDVAPKLGRRLSRTPAEVTATVGTTPWADGTQVTIRAADRSRRGARLIDNPTYAVDLEVFTPERLLPGGSIAGLATSLTGLLSMGIDLAPELSGSAGDPQRISGASQVELGGTYKIASLGGLRDGWLVDGTGARVAVGDNATFAGLVTALAWSPSSGALDVTVLLTSWRSGEATLERAPSAIVGSSSTTTVINLDATEAHGASPGDAFTVGDQIEMCSADGTRSGDVGTIASKTATSITMGAALASAPVAGEVVRLQESVNFGNTTRYSSTSRPFAYLDADGATGIEDVDGNLTGPDVYGYAGFSGGGGGTAPALADVPFVGVDDAAVTSADETASQPYDAWLAYTLRANESNLIQRGYQVSWCPVTHGAGDYGSGSGHRPYASSRPSTILYLPWLKTDGLKSIRLNGIARAGSETSSAPELTAAIYTVTLEVAGKTQTRQLSEAIDIAEDWADDSFDLSVDVPEVGPVFPVALWGQSDPQGWVVSDETITTLTVDFGREASADSGTPYTDTTSARPNADALDLQVTQLDAGPLLEHLQPKSATEMYVTAPLSTPNDGAVTRWLSYLQVAGVDIVAAHEDSTYEGDATLRPLRTISSDIEVNRLARAEAARNRPRLLWVGPVGDRPNETETVLWPADYTRRHVVHNADDSTTTSKVLDASIWLDTSAPRVIVLAHVLPVHYLDQPLLIDPISNASVGTWEGHLKVLQLEDGDAGWSGATSVGDTSSSVTDFELIHYPAVARGDFPALYQHHLQRENSLWTHREGQLFREDTRLVQTVALSVDVSAYNATEPLRVEFHLEHTSTDWGNGFNNAATGLDLVVVGVTVWEAPT